MRTRLSFLDPHPDGSPGVLLLHGLGANGSSWQYQFEPLIKAGMRPIAPDMPGFGGSGYDGRGWNFRRMAVILAEFLDELGTGPVHVVGLSMGGVIAQQFALDQPARVRKLVLVSTFSVLRPHSLSQWLYFLQRALVVHTMGLKSQSKIVARRVFPYPGQGELRALAEQQIATANPAAYRSAMRGLAMFDSRKRLHEICVPTLVISGENDSTVACTHQRLLAEQIRGARQVVITDAGHAVSIDQHQAFNCELLGFL